MFLQQRHAAEGARADAALVLLHLGVGLQMSSQVGAVGEGPVAVGAGERALTWTEKGAKTWRVSSVAHPFTCGSNSQVSHEFTRALY